MISPDIAADWRRAEAKERDAPPTSWGATSAALPSKGRRKMTPAALSSAIDVALRPLGVRLNVLPATPERVLNWIEEAKTRGG
jgi:hypothetical protein